MDEDLSHTIDFSEFLTLMARQEYADDPEAEVQAAFNIFDINGDGKISHQVLCSVSYGCLIATRWAYMQC